MNIPFRRIGATPQSFEVSKDGVALKGTLVSKRRGLVFLKAYLKGSLTLPCDICAEPFDTVLDEALELLLSDGVFEGSDDDIDVVEMHQGMIDLDEVLHSEIELIRSDYHSCPNCKN
jgi:uncharacterized metal-binding protein YceD (DUF177 family)